MSNACDRSSQMRIENWPLDLTKWESIVTPRTVLEWFGGARVTTATELETESTHR